MLYLLFALSGASGLIYQVTWVRQLGLVFGNTVQSASVVTSVFMAGLGLGAWAAGRWIDRSPRSGLAAYGAAELLIGLLGVVLASLLPTLATLALPGSEPVQDSTGWWVVGPLTVVIRIGLAALLLAPSSLLMGATLTLLVRHITASPEAAGLRIGMLYGSNTLGAAVGALCTDLLLVPNIGLWGAAALAASANAGAGIAALSLLRRYPSATARPGQAGAPWPLGPATALFLAGFAALGLEMVWLRFLAGALGPYRGVLSVLLAIVLLGLAIGAAGAGLAIRRGVQPRTAFAISQTAVVVTALGGLVWFDPVAVLTQQHAVSQAFLDATPAGRSWIVHRLNGGTIAGLVLLPAIAMGAAFPLGNALAHDALGHLGRRTGQLYLSTTAGNVLGALVVGFVLLPGPGLQVTAAILAGISLASATMVGPRGWGAVSTAIGALTLAIFLSLPSDLLLWRTFPAHRVTDEGVLAVREGLEQIAVVTGSEDGPARLWTSGHPMTSTTPHAQRYMRLMAHLPLLLHPEARRALVIAFGAGNTAHAASLHPLDALHIADLSRDVLELAPLFEHANRGVLRDPRVRVFVDDGRHHLGLQDPGSYDLITLEPPPLAAAGVSSLYAREFYEVASSRLAPEGLLAQWLPAYQVPEADVRALVRAFVDVFPETVLLMGSGRELILLGSQTVHRFSPSRVEEQLSERPAVAEDLNRIGLGSARELALTFVADHATLVAATRTARAVTDNRPTLEHAAASHIQQTRLPADLFDTTTIGRWCPDCTADPTLSGWLVVTGSLTRSETFLSYSSIAPDDTARFMPPDLSDPTLAAIAQSTTLQRVLVTPDTLALRAAELWEAGDHEAALQHLDAARQQAPGVPILEETATRWRERL